MLAFKVQRAESTELRELREEIKKNNSKVKARSQQCSVRIEKPDEDCKMEVDGEADSRKKLDMWSG